MSKRMGPHALKERVFVEAMATTGDALYAARQAGYAQPARDAARTLAKPAAQAEIARRQIERLFNEALPAAIDCLVSIIRNERAPAGARVQASKVVLDRTLGTDDPLKAREPHEMSADEIAGEIEKLTRMAADRAKVVTGQSAAGFDIFA